MAGKSATRKVYERRLTQEVQNVDLIIENINKVTADAIQILEKQKEEILTSNEEITEEITPEQIEERIEGIAKVTEVVHDKHEKIIERKTSLNIQSEKIIELDKQIETLVQERDDAIKVFINKKEFLQERIKSIQNIDIDIGDLHYKKTLRPIRESGDGKGGEGGGSGEEGGIEQERGGSGRGWEGGYGYGGDEEEEGEDKDVEDLQIVLDQYGDPNIKSGLLGSQDICICTPLTSATSSTTHTSTSRDEGPSPDCLYLQRTVGSVLKIALSEIIMKKPRDPIHYLGHFLLKFRLNQEQDMEKVKEFTNLMNERIRLENQRLHDMFTNEAQAAILDLIIRAEEELIRQHLAEVEGEGEEEEMLTAVTT